MQLVPPYQLRVDLIIVTAADHGCLAKVRAHKSDGAVQPTAKARESSHSRTNTVLLSAFLEDFVGT